MPSTVPVLTPPLIEGDHLTRDEFLRRWEAMPDLTRAELIDGVVHMPSPVSAVHCQFQGRASGWLWSYAAATPGCAFLPGGTWLMSKDSAPQPDLSLEILPEFGGQSKVEGKYLAGAPELIVEISHTTAAKDQGKKLSLYERSGVREYLIVRPQKKQLLSFVLADGKYREMEPHTSMFQSHVFPGLWLDRAAFWNDDSPGILTSIQRGVATPEHANFVRKLALNKR